jgi:hypothetical protein
VTRLVRSELSKARTTRTAIGLALGLLAIVLLFVILHALLTDRSPAEAFGVNAHHTRDNLAVLGFAPLFALLFGLMASTSEYRHGTMSATLVAAPVRTRVVAAKVVACALVGLGLAATAAVIGAAVGLSVLAARGFDIDAGEAGRAMVGVAAGGLLWGALGAALGAIVKAQVPAIVGALAWILVVESLLQGLVPSVGRFAPGGALNAFLGFGGDDNSLPVAAGVALTVAYVAAAAVLGAALTQRRDIT